MNKISNLLKSLKGFIRSLAALILLSATSATGFAQVLPRPSHIVVLIEDMEPYVDIIGNTYAPYLNALAQDSNSAVFTQMYSIEYPGQPDYLDFFSGSNQGVTNDNLPTGYPFTTDNLARELLDSNLTFKTYSQDLPYVGYDSITAPPAYVRKDNPVTNWVGTGANQVPATCNQPFTLWPLGNLDSLPTIAYVVPDEDSDMHNGTGDPPIESADYWFNEHLSSLLPWALANNTLLIVTWDEDDGFYDNNIPTIFYGPMVKGGNYGDTLNLFNILRTLEDMYGLRHAGAADTTTPITNCWKTATTAGTLGLFMDTVTGAPGQQVVVNLKADNFTNMLSAAGTITFDTSKLHFNSVSQYGLSSLNASDFGTAGAANGYITFSWTDTTHLGVSLANDSVFFALRFTVAAGTCTGTALNFTDSPVALAFTNTSQTITTYYLGAGLVQSTAGSVTPTIGISGNNVICTGGTADFTASITNGGNAPQYQWVVNGIGVSNNSSFSSSTLNNGDEIICILTSNAACASPTVDTSNSLTMSVQSSLTPVITIGATATSICPGAVDTFTAAATGQGTTPTYQWQINGANSGNNTNIFTSSSLQNADKITCILTSSATRATRAVDTSNAITVTLLTAVTPTISIAGNNVICTGSATTFTASISNGGAAPLYQWQVNGVVAGTNNGSFTSSSLNNGDMVFCILTSNAACASPAADTSNIVTMNVSNSVVPTATVSTTETVICEGQSVTFTASVTGQGSTPTYQWKISGTNAGPNDTVFTTGSLSGNATITLNLTSSLSCANPADITSNGVAITVNPLPPTPVIHQSGDTLFSSATNGNQWFRNDTVLTGETGNFYLPPYTGYYSVLETDANNCSSDTSAQFDYVANGIEQIGSLSFYIYPNPASNEINIQSGNAVVTRIEMINTLGQTVVSNEVNRSFFRIDVSNIAAGIYLLQLHTNSGAATQTISIRRD